MYQYKILSLLSLYLQQFALIVITFDCIHLFYMYCHPIPPLSLPSTNISICQTTKLPKIVVVFPAGSLKPLHIKYCGKSAFHLMKSFLAFKDFWARVGRGKIHLASAI